MLLLLAEKLLLLRYRLELRGAVVRGGPLLRVLLRSPLGRVVVRRVLLLLPCMRVRLLLLVR